MSERRSTEIKFRTTPSFKARVQAAAAASDKSMSEFLEECAETRMWADANQKLDGTALLGSAIGTLSPNAVSLQEYISTNPAFTAEIRDVISGTRRESTPEPKGWMFEARQ